MKPFDYYKPKSISEALNLLNKYKEEACILNGATDLLVRMRSNLISPQVLIDIKGIKALHEITIQEDKLTLGACVTLSDLENHPLIQERLPFFVDAIKSIGSVQIRNRATCIGNICNASPLADTATPLLALDAVLHIHGPKGAKEVLLTEFFIYVRETILANDEIVTGITIPQTKGIQGKFTKISRRKKVDLSTVCSTVIKKEATFKIAYGSVAPTPIRLHKTEKFLENKRLTPALITEACAIADTEISPIDDIRSTQVYRSQMVKVMLKNSLTHWLKEVR